MIPVETLGALQQRNDTVDKKGQEQEDKSLLSMDSHLSVQLPLVKSSHSIQSDCI